MSLHNTQSWRASRRVHEIGTCTISSSLGEGFPTSIKKNETESNVVTPQLKEKKQERTVDQGKLKTEISLQVPNDKKQPDGFIPARLRSLLLQI